MENTQTNAEAVKALQTGLTVQKQMNKEMNIEKVRIFIFVQKQINIIRDELISRRGG
jgi:hypothetical protein